MSLSFYLKFVKCADLQKDHKNICRFTKDEQKTDNILKRSNFELYLSEM